MNSSSIDSDNQNVTLGVLRGDDTGLHEVIGALSSPAVAKLLLSCRIRARHINQSYAPQRPNRENSPQAKHTIPEGPSSSNDNSRTSRNQPPTKSSCRTRKQLQLHFDHDKLIVAFVVCHPLQPNFRLFLSDRDQRLVPLSR